ncbi:MAG: hypothetical protein IJW79_11245, partial [Clostridia bacterium]|nr:hypothetical protein [Clostridia bacterium]
TVNTYLSSKGLFPNNCGGVIEQNKLKLTKNQWWHDGADSGTKDDFRDLFYGLYTDENGNALTDYYMELDYTLITPRETKSYTFTGTDSDEKTVTYTVYCPYRGESYFNPMSGGGYNVYLFKVSPTGYLYTPGTSSTVKTVKFTTAASGKSDSKYFTYTKKVGDTTVATQQPVTETVWNEMVANCGSAVTSGSTFDRVHYSGDEFYQMEVGKEYTIRTKMSVDSAKKVTATVYIRPAGSDEPFSKVGSTSYTYDGSSSWVTDNKDIRISENFHVYSLDNMKFVNLGACEGEHDFPVINKSVVNDNGIDTYNEMNCLKCGAVYYENCATNTVIESFDFTKKTDYDEFKNGETYNNSFASTNPTFTENTGLVFSGSDLHFNIPTSEKNAEYRMTYTATINKLPTDQSATQPGSSFFTDRTGNGWIILLRMGRYADYDDTKTDNEGWLKLRTTGGGQAWGSYESAYTIKEGETYKFSVVIKPSQNLFDLYIDDKYIGTGGMDTSKWSSTSKPYYRIANQLNIGMVLKDYSFAKIEKQQSYELFKGADEAFSLNMGTLKPQLDANGNIVSKNTATFEDNISSVMYLEDTDLMLANTPYTLSFDFMMTDTGAFKDGISTESSLWSLISWTPWISSTTARYGTMVRVGALDNDSTKEGFEKFFLIMNNKSGYSDSADNGNQGYTTEEGGEIAGYYTDKNSVFSFEAGEWITITLSVNPLTQSAYLYANGQLAGSAPASAYTADLIKSGETVVRSRLRIGDAFRKLFYNWAIKDIKLETTPGVVAEVKDSGTIFNVDFGGTYATNSGNNPNLGNIVHNNLPTLTQVKDTATTEGYTNFVADMASFLVGATNLCNLSLTSTVGDGTYYNHVEGKKYAIEAEFSLLDRPLTEGELADLEAYNKKTYDDESKYLQMTRTKRDSNVIRLSKYHDNNAIQLIQQRTTALVAITADSSAALELYTRNADGALVKASAWYKDTDVTDGKIPDSAWVKVKTVIDESDDTFSVYINDSIAFYKSGDTYKRAENLKMKLTTGANSFATLYPDAPEMETFNKTGLYKDLPRTVTVDGVTKAYNFAKLENMCYVRFFQNTLEFNVRSLSVTKIEDGLNFVGVQRRDESETPLAFDLRFVFATDDIYVDGIEYDVTAEVGDVGSEKIESVVCDTVYSTLKSSNGDINAWKFEEGEYFSAFNVEGIETASESTVYTFRITPYMVRYNATSGKTEKDPGSADIVHVVKFNGKGELIGYTTESSEWADLSMTYTEIENVPYKALGRTQMLDGSLTADWSAAGIEFEAYCIGDVAINANVPITRNFTVVVDGVEQKNFALANGINYIATGLDYGKHSFKIMNQDGYSGVVNINGVTLRGTFEEAPADSDLLIEFIGDSITHGCGLGSADYSAGTNDGTLTYAFLAAKELGADYTIMANGGMGVLWGSDYKG